MVSTRRMTNSMQGRSKENSTKGKGKVETRESEVMVEENSNELAMVVVSSSHVALSYSQTPAYEAEISEDEETVSDLPSSRRNQEDGSESESSEHPTKRKSKSTQENSMKKASKSKSTSNFTAAGPSCMSKKRRREEKITEDSTTVAREKSPRAKTFKGRCPPNRSRTVLKRFQNAEAKKRYEILNQREILEQRLVNLDDPDELGMKLILEKGKMEATVTRVSGYVKELVVEIYAHLPSVKTRKSVVDVYVRGEYRKLSVDKINAYYGFKKLTKEETAAEASVNGMCENKLALFMSGNTIGEWKLLSISDFTMKSYFVSLQ